MLRNHEVSLELGIMSVSLWCLTNLPNSDIQTNHGNFLRNQCLPSLNRNTARWLWNEMSSSSRSNLVPDCPNHREYGNQFPLMEQCFLCKLRLKCFLPLRPCHSCFNRVFCTGLNPSSRGRVHPSLSWLLKQMPKSVFFWLDMHIICISWMDYHFLTFTLLSFFWVLARLLKSEASNGLNLVLYCNSFYLNLQ